MPRLDPFKIEREDDNTFLTIYYPELPYNTDFETFRKTDKQWQKIVEHFKKRGHITGYGHRYGERFIFCHWPRDPDGPFMEETLRGKVAGNRYPLWGATLYDFYRVYRSPQHPNLECLSTGSKLAAWMKEIGELNHAKDLIERASLEDEPYEMKVYDIGQYIEVLEQQVWRGRVGKTVDIDRTDVKIGTLGLYAPSKYPAPWPLRPFSAPLARLQKRIPHSSLPQNLVVHDPWNVLLVRNTSDRKLKPSTCKWETKADIIRTYHLQLTEQPHGQKIPDSDEILPRKDQHCPVAHLYITPKRRIGSGHHSLIYQVELELPREMLVQPKVCYECSEDRYEMVRKAAADRKKDHDMPEKIKQMSLDDFMKVISIDEEDMDDRTMQENYSLLFKQGRPFVESDRGDPLFELVRFAQRQTGPPYCEHLDRGIPAPPSQRVSVVAKLALPDPDSDSDDNIEAHSKHLSSEAANYQAFPSHMFEHWNGYNVHHPSHHPTPLGALVPQFYGFYVPDEDNEPIKDERYMSPILLLEHCGKQIKPRELSPDDREECFALLRRLHLADYFHRSVAQRNILVQHGPLMESPFKRSSLHPRFRLIDFGRTVKWPKTNAIAEQDMEVQRANVVLGRPEAW